METTRLKKFAQYARRSLIEQISAKLNLVLAENSAARRERGEVITVLDGAIKHQGKEQVIERVAYTWFNRFCALRFMDINRYTRIGVVSPVQGQFQPEILADAKMGHVDEEIVGDTTRKQIFDLLDGKVTSRDPQGEAYRLMVVAVCNHWNRAMPFLFERINNYTELLMPDDLLSGNSILAYTREAMTPDVCRDVEVIGWLYQFYISEKKDEVFAGLKKRKKITPENIPAATQLFTPHWIVRYLVENSLGRLWMLNRPNSKLIERMDFYIKAEQPETDFLHIDTLEKIKICDPACGSGHMLTYAFDLLYDIYEEEGYEPSEIPEKILINNLYGIEIDERAGVLAAFALTMKALSALGSGARQRRFLRKQILPNICILENVELDSGAIKTHIDVFGKELFKDNVIDTLKQFEEADNFGSLIVPKAKKLNSALTALMSLKERSNAKTGSAEQLTKEELVLVRAGNFRKIIKALQQADYLSQKYHVVIANPPYLGSKGMNTRLGTWLKDNYADVKSDLFSAFIVRNTELALPKGQLGFMSPFVWMFISSYEKLRSFLINQKTITSLVQLEYSGFDGATVPICTFTLENTHHPDFKGGYVRLSNFRGSENQGPRTLQAIKNSDCGWFYRASGIDFRKLPGFPIAYWVSNALANTFSTSKSNVGSLVRSEGKNVTTNNARFTRTWWEVDYLKVGAKSRRWFPFAAGGPFRKWFGNNTDIVDWSEKALQYYRKSPAGRLIREEFWFLKGVTWSKITSSKASFRLLLENQTYQEVAILVDKIAKQKLPSMLGLLNSNVAEVILKALAPTLNYQLDDICRIPWRAVNNAADHTVATLIEVSKRDWDNFESSWDFTCLPLLNPDYRQSTLKVIYQKLRAHWLEVTLEMQRLEEENNRIFINAYGLESELDEKVDRREITLTCNPHYRYNGDKSEEELESLLLTDTMRELISYAIGCMFGRYSLEKPGLILANQGETIEDYLKQVSAPSFPADDDNVIPMLDGDWFTDDIAERFRKFLRVAFGEEHYEENLAFLEDSLYPTNLAGKKRKTIRDYFLRDFYNDHVKRYKKRPIYWLFSSPKGSFNALIYMHRYRPDTVSVVLNDYLREFRTKLTSQKSHLEAVSISGSASKNEKAKALKKIENISKMISEMEEYEREVLYPLATEQIQIDLDDGVKVNYPKFGRALKKITGLS